MISGKTIELEIRLAALEVQVRELQGVQEKVITVDRFTGILNSIAECADRAISKTISSSHTQ